MTLLTQNNPALDSDLFVENPDGVPSDRNLKHLVAWNCDLKDSLQFSEFSLMQVQTCANISSQYNKPHDIMGQVVQAKKYEDMSVIECKFLASFYTAYCSYNLISGYRLWDSQGQIMNMHLPHLVRAYSNLLEDNKHFHEKTSVKCYDEGWNDALESLKK